MSFHCDSLVLGLVLFVCLFSLLFFLFWLWFCYLLRVFGCCVFLFSPWNHIISVHHEPEAYYSIGFYCRIHTASKYLHNDLARAIKALEQKKKLISMVLRHWSSRLALRPASNIVSSYNFFLVCCNFHNLEASRLALRPSLCASCGLKF